MASRGVTAPTSGKMQDSDFLPRVKMKGPTHADINNDQIYTLKQKTMILSDCWGFPARTPSNSTSWISITRFYLDAPDWCSLAAAANLNGRVLFYAGVDGGSDTAELRLTNVGLGTSSTGSIAGAAAMAWVDPGSDFVCSTSDGTEQEFHLEFRFSTIVGSNFVYCSGLALFDTSGL